MKIDFENIQKQIFKEMDEVEEELNQDGRSNPVLNESQPIIIQRKQSDNYFQDHLNASVLGDNQATSVSGDPSKHFSTEFLGRVFKSPRFLRLPFEKQLEDNESQNH